MRADAIAAAVGVLVALGWIMSQAPNRASVYMADSPPAQTEAAHRASPVAAGEGLAALLSSVR
jgi:hypothetical protein